MSNSGEETTVIREAGDLEKFLITRSALGLYTSVVIGAQYSDTPGRKLDKEALFPALRRVIQREPALRVCVEGAYLLDTSRPSYIPCQVTDAVLERIVLFKNELCWAEEDPSDALRLVEDQFKLNYDTEDTTVPLWRLLVLSDNTLLFFYHHGIGDGKSGVSFHIMLLDALNIPPSKLESDSDITPEKMSPPLEQCVALKPSILTVVSAILRLFIPVSWTKLHSAWTGNFVTAIPSPKDPNSSDLGVEVQARMDLLELSPEDSKALLDISRKHGTTVTSTLYTIAVVILSRVVLDQVNTNRDIKRLSPDKFSSLKTLVPVSMRPLSDIPQIAFANHSSTLSASPPLRRDFRWEDAKACATSLKQSMKKGGKSSEEVGLIKFLFGNHAAYFKGKMGKKRPATLQLSNIGKFPGVDSSDAAGPWKIGRTLFSQTDVIIGPAFNLDVIGHGTGGLSISMTWGVDALEDELARRIVKDMKNGVMNIVRHDTL